MVRTTIAPNIVNHRVAGLGFLRVDPKEEVASNLQRGQIRAVRGVIVASVLCAAIWIGLLAILF